MLSLSNNRLKMILAAALSVALLSSCASKQEAREADLVTTLLSKQVSTNVVLVTYDSLVGTAQVNARVELINRVIVAFEPQGGYTLPDPVLTKFHVLPGTKVDEGTLLATITVDVESVEVELQKLSITLAQLKKQLADTTREITAAKNNYAERMTAEENPDKKEIIRQERLIYERRTSSDIPNLQAEVKEMEDKIAAFEAAREPLSVLSPIKGVVEDLRRLGTGERLGYSMGLMTIMALDQYQLTMQADSRYARFGMPVMMTLMSNGTKGEAMIASDPLANPIIERPGGTIGFKLRPSVMFTEAELLASLTKVMPVDGCKMELTKTLVVPKSAVTAEDNKRYFVTVMRDGTSIKRYIKIGMETPDWIQIIYGLEEGDEIAE